MADGSCQRQPQRSDPGRCGLWSDTVGSSGLSRTHVLRRVHTESRRCCQDTHIIADGTTVVHADSRSAGFPNGYELTQLIAEKLLPCADPDGGLQGQAGVRVAGVDRADLALTFVDTSARVTLRAAPKSRWNNAIETYWESLELAASKSLWDTPEPTEEERYFLEAPRWGRWPGIDWLACGLLRRIALYRTFCLAFHVSAWTLGNTWKIEIDTDPVTVPFTAAFLRQSRPGVRLAPPGYRCNLHV